MIQSNHDFSLPCVCVLGYEPVIVVTCLDLVCRDAVCHGRSWEVDVHHKQDKACAEAWAF